MYLSMVRSFIGFKHKKSFYFLKLSSEALLWSFHFCDIFLVKQGCTYQFFLCSESLNLTSGVNFFPWSARIEGDQK